MSLTRPQRIAIHGPSGTGKSTFARLVGQELHYVVAELDGWYHQAEWTPLPLDDFREKVRLFADGEQWVCDGNYSAIRDLVWAQADTIVVMVYPRWFTLQRLVRRTLSRMITQQILWNGNTEKWSNLFSRDPQKNIILWMWHHHRPYCEEILESAHRHAPHATIHYVQRPRDADDLLATWRTL